MEEENNLLLAAAMILRIRNRRPDPRWTVWVKTLLLRRPENGHCENLLQELHREGTSYKNFLRVLPELFMELIERVGSRLQKQDTFWNASSYNIVFHGHWGLV